MRSNALHLHGVCKRYRAGIAGCEATVEVLHDVEWTVRAGEIVGVLGASGAGKSTLLLLAAGLMRPDSGTVTWFGGSPRGGSPWGIAYLPFRKISLPDLTVREALDLEASTRVLAAAARRRMVGAILNRAGLAEHAESLLAHLLPLDANRFIIARALLESPRLLLLDEPLAGPSSVDRDHLNRVLGELAEDGATIVVASADRVALEDCVHRTAVLANRSLVTEQATRAPDVLQRSTRVAERGA